MAFTQWALGYTDVAGVDGYNAFAKKYGAVGDGAHDDTAALQDSANDAIAVNGGIWFLPPPPIYYKTTSTITLQSQGSNGYIFGLCPGGGFAPINYQGPSGTSAIVVDSIQWSKFYGLSVTLGGTFAANQVAFDFRFIVGDNIPSLKLEKCNVQLQGTGGSHVGFRLGQNGGPSNMPFAVFDQCTVTGEGNSQGSIGFQIGGSEVLATTLLGCTVSNVGQMFLSGAISSYLPNGCGANDTTLTVFDTFLFPNSGTVLLGGQEQIIYTGKTVGTLPGTPGTLTGVTRGANGTQAQAWAAGVSATQYVPGQGAYPGADDWQWIGGGGGGNARDFQSGGKFHISDVRMENGQHFLMTNGFNQTYSGASLATLTNVTLASYTQPSDGFGVISLSQNDRLIATRLKVYGNTQLFNGGFIVNYNSSQNNGSVRLEDFMIVGSYPLWTIKNNWPVHAHGTLLNLDGSTNRRIYVDFEPPTTLTDAATVTVDLSFGTEYVLLMTGAVGANRAVAFSNASPGMEFQLYFQQPATGGPCSVNSWPGGISWKGGSPPTFSTAANAIDKITFTVLGSGSYFGSY